MVLNCSQWAITQYLQHEIHQLVYVWTKLIHFYKAWLLLYISNLLSSVVHHDPRIFSTWSYLPSWLPSVTLILIFNCSCLPCTCCQSVSGSASGAEASSAWSWASWSHCQHPMESDPNAPSWSSQSPSDFPSCLSCSAPHIRQPQPGQNIESSKPPKHYKQVQPVPITKTWECVLFQ